VTIRVVEPYIIREECIEQLHSPASGGNHIS